MTGFKRKLIRHSSVLILALFLAALSGACSSEKKTSSYKDMIGDISYDSSMYVMSVENIEDEEEAGVVYRKVTDSNLIKTSEIPVLLYFYSSIATDKSGITAGVEDIAQQLGGRVLVVGIDVVSNSDISGEYEISYVPDFVLLQNGEVKDSFKAIERDYWTVTDVYNWLLSNKI